MPKLPDELVARTGYSPALPRRADSSLRLANKTTKLPKIKVVCALKLSVCALETSAQTEQKQSPSNQTGCK